MSRVILNLALIMSVIPLSSCFSTTGGGEDVTAVNLRTGQIQSFESAEEIPDGWAVCEDAASCPNLAACLDLAEASCISRQDCSPVYAESTPPVCNTGSRPTLDDRPEFCDRLPFVGCSGTNVCQPDDCGQLPPTRPVICDDGTTGGITGRCLTNGD